MNERDPAPMTPDEQYLWDATGRPDDATAQIESALRALRYRAEPPPLPRPSPLRPLALAAGLLLAGLAAYLIINRPAPTPPPTWTIASAHGDIRVSEPRPLKSTLTIRDITTFDGARLTLRAGSASTVQFENAAHLEVVDGADQHPWLAISDGLALVQVAATDRPILLGIHASTIAMQPGVAASVHTTADQTRLTCKTGEAYIDWPHQDTRLLGPATCTIHAEQGPALPMPAAAPPEACNAIDALDQTLRMSAKNPKATDALLMAFLDSATRSDAPTLWNLLHRVPPDYRRHVRDALARLIDPPPTINPDLILKLDPAAMDAWWKASVRAAQSN